MRNKKNQEYKKKKKSLKKKNPNNPKNEALNGLKAVVSGEIRHSNPAYAKASAGSPAIHPRDKSLGILATENKMDYYMAVPLVSHGFMLVQLIIFFAIASMMSLSLFESLNQTNRVVQLSDNMVNMDQRILILQDRLEKDITGAFIPLYLPPKKEKEKKEITQEEKKEEKIADKKGGQKKKPASTFKPIEKAFFSTNSGKHLKELSFITSNPFSTYDSKKPLIARVRYLIEPDEMHKGAFKILRQESLKLAYNAIAVTGGPRAYLIADNIKSCSITYYAPPEKKEGEKEKKGKKEDEEEFVEYESWNSDAKAKSKSADRYLLAHHLLITISLWDIKKKNELEYEFIFPIFADKNPQVPKEKKDQNGKSEPQQGGLDVDNMPKTKRFVNAYREHRWQQQN